MLITVIIIALLAVYGLVYKIPLVCYGCEAPSGISAMFFKCIVDTSKDSELCKISANIDDLPAQITDTGKRVTTAIVKEVTENIPATVKLAYDNLMREINKIVQLIMANLENFKNKTLEFIISAYSDVKDIVIKTKDELYSQLIEPIIQFLSQYIVDPIKILINMLIDFKNLLADSIQSAVKDMTGVIVNLRDNLVGVISSIPKYIEQFINALMDIINFTTDETVDGMNKAISGVVGVTNSAIGGMAGAVNTSTAVMTDTTKALAIGVQNGVNEVVGGINKGIVDNVNLSLTKMVDGLKTAINEGVIKPVNITGDGISTTINGSINPIIGVINETTDGLNKARDVTLPKIEIPELKLPEVDLKITKLPSTTIINKTQITPEIKPFGFMPKIDTVAGINLDIKDVPGVEIPYAQSIPQLQGVTFDLNFNIPRITGPDASDPNKFISVKSDLIPKPLPINGGTPKDGKTNFLNMRKGGFLPQVSLDPAVKTISDELYKPMNTASSFIKGIYDETMDPINKVIQDLITLSQSLISSVKMMFYKYLNREYLNLVISEISKGVKYTYGVVLDLIKTNVISPMMDLFDIAKKQIMKNIMIVVEIIKGFFKDVLDKLQVLFRKVADILYETGKVVVKTGGYFLFYMFGQAVDYIPLPINISMKINILLLFAAFIMFMWLKPIIDMWPLILGTGVVLGGVSLGFVKSDAKPVVTTKKPLLIKR